MRKKLTKSSKVIQYIKKNPNARAKEIASAVGVPTASVYQIAYKVRKQIREGMAKVRMTALAPKLAASKTTRGMKVIATYTSNKSIKSDFIEAKNLGYNLGNVVKYVSRADLKGNKLEDLQKARWYLDRAIANISKT